MFYSSSSVFTLLFQNLSADTVLLGRNLTTFQAIVGSTAAHLLPCLSLYPTLRGDGFHDHDSFCCGLCLVCACRILSLRAHLYYGIPGKFLPPVPAVKRDVSFILGSKKKAQIVRKNVSCLLVRRHRSTYVKKTCLQLFLERSKMQAIAFMIRVGGKEPVVGNESRFHPPRNVSSLSRNSRPLSLSRSANCSLEFLPRTRPWMRLAPFMAGHLRNERQWWAIHRTSLEKI